MDHIACVKPNVNNGPQLETHADSNYWQITIVIGWAKEPASTLFRLWLSVSSSCCRSASQTAQSSYPFSLNRWILPVSVLGSASIKTTERGYL